MGTGKDVETPGRASACVPDEAFSGIHVDGTLSPAKRLARRNTMRSKCT